MSSDKLARSTKQIRSEGIIKAKTRTSMNLLDHDRNFLLESLRDVKKKHELEADKNFELGRNLAFQAEHIKHLEADREQLAEKTKSLQSKLEELENAQDSLLHERSSLKMSVAQLQEEVHINRLQASDKEVYIEKLASSYNNEKETILSVHNKHSRLLTSKLLAESVQRLVANHKAWAFFGVKKKIKQKVAIGRLGFRFLVKAVKKRVKFGFWSLKENVREQNVEKMLTSFVERNRRMRIKKKIFEGIRLSAFEMRKKLGKVRKGAEKVWIIEQVRVKVRVLRFLHQWKNVKVKDLYGKRVLWGVVMKKYSRSLEGCLRHWGGISKLCKQLQANEDLASDLSAFSIKQGVFYEFKRIAQLEAEKRKFNLFMNRLQVHKNKYKVLKLFKNYKSVQSLKRKRLSHMCLHFSNKSIKNFYRRWQFYVCSLKRTCSISRVLKTHHKKNQELEKKNLFLTWKIFFNYNKRLAATKQLESEVPKREGYEQAYKELIDNNQEMLLVKSLKNMMRNSNNFIRSYFFIWQTAVYNFHQGTRNICKKAVHLYMTNIKEAFEKWNEFKHMSNIGKLAQENNETHKENQVLLEHIANLDSCLKATTEAKNLISILNLIKCVKNICRKTKISNLRRWAQKSFKVSNYLTGANNITSILYLNIIHDSFVSLQLLNDKKAKKQIRQKKFYLFTFKKWKKVNMILLESWINYVKLKKYHQSKINKILIKKYKQTSQNGFETWKIWLETLLVNERDVQYEILDNEFNQVREELEEVCNCLSLEKNQTWKLQNQIRNKKLKRFFFTLCSMGSIATSIAMRKWKFFLRNNKMKVKYLSKMINYCVKSDLKQALRIWNYFKSCSIKASSSSNISSLMTEKKSLRRDMNVLKNNLESVIQEKEETIQQHIRNSQRLSNKVEKFLEISVRKQKDTIKIPKSHFFFQEWKANHLYKKNKISRLLKLTNKSKVFKGFQSIFCFALRVFRQQTLQSQIYKFILSFRSRKLKHAFHAWMQNSYSLVQNGQSKEIQIFSNKLNTLATRYQSSKKNSINKAMKFVQNKKKLLIVLGWQKLTRKIKMIKEANTYFEKLTASMKSKYGINEWVDFTRYRLKNKEFEYIMMRSRLEKLKKLTFSHWKNTHMVGKTVAKALKKTNFHSNRDYKFFAFTCIKSFVSTKLANLNWFSYTKKHLLITIFNISTKQELLHSLHLWHMNSKFISVLLQKLQKIISRAKIRLLQKGFLAWIYKSALLKTIQNVENHGKSAKKLKKLRSVLTVLQKFIRKEGLLSQYLDQYLMQLLPPRHYLSFKGVDKSDRLYFNFLFWKLFVLKRQKIRSASFRMRVFMNKPLLLQKFLHWKRICSFSATLRNLPRRSLMQKLADFDKETLFLKETLKEKHISLKYLESYTDVLEEHVRRGQNQALGYMAARMKKSLQTSFFRWFFNSLTIQIVENDLHAKDLEEELLYARRKCKDYDVENKELIIENKGLLHALMKAEDLIMKIHH